MKQYRNSERTKKWIRRAFMELIAEKKSLNRITVNELAERADITKTTFYYHYDDIYAVAEEFENELIAQLNGMIDEIMAENPSDYSGYIQKILAFIKENEENYRLAVNSSDLTVFESKLKSIFSKRMVAMSMTEGLSPGYEKRAVQVCFLISACVDTTVQYLKGELPSSLELVGEVITEAIERLSRKD